MNYERHFLSACWPDITGEEYEHLKDSISVSGLRESITLYEGQILDGWNRYRACIDTAMSMQLVDFDGTPEEAEQFVRDKHNRRSLTLTQRMACEAKMSTWPGRGGDRFTKNQSAPGALCSASSAVSPQNRTELAKKTGGSVRTAQQVINVVKSGNEEAINAMVQGKLSAKAADAKVKGKDKIAPTTPKLAIQEDDGAPDEAEFNSVAAAEKAEAMAMRLLLASDEPLADVTEKYKQSLLQIEQLSARIVGLQNQSTQQVKTIKALQTKLKKLEQAA